ncbi:MAG: tol-pal system protein YbgF, partial [Alphaproteobacteria bacterium]
RSFLMRRDFASAEVAFRTFIEANPESDLVGNAQYWLGETYYVRENYLDAARAFAEGYQNFPASGKAPDNLLKLGLALANLDRKDDACITLSRLSSEYPEASANIRQRAAREHDRLGCG